MVNNALISTKIYLQIFIIFTCFVSVSFTTTDTPSDRTFANLHRTFLKMYVRVNG